MSNITPEQFIAAGSTGKIPAQLRPKNQFLAMGDRTLSAETGYNEFISPVVPSTFDYSPAEYQKYMKGANQNWARKLRNGVVSRGLSIIPKVLQGAGHVGGLVGAAATGDITKI